MTQKETLTFQQKTSRPVLSRSECLYWLDMFRKIIKIGTEFEINLPSSEHAVKAANTQPCVKAKNGCATDCGNVESCLVDRHPAMCLTKDTGVFANSPFACPAVDYSDTAACKTCPAWYLNCRSFNCSLYTPACTTCSFFSRKTSKALENVKITGNEEDIRKEIAELLTPSESVGAVGKYGVLEVKKDGSLLHNGGIEIPTVGRRVHWNSFYDMCAKIIDPIVERGGYINERCGQHFHVLAGYFSSMNGHYSPVSEMEHSLPEIVLANFHQLCRRYELALFWMMSTGDSPNHLTRWAKFRVPITRYSAINSKMTRVQEEMASSIEKNGKYAATAYHFCSFDPDGNVGTFHIENRVADGCLSPAVVTAWAMLLYALVLKAVRFSQYGILETGDSDFISKVKEVSPHLINGAERSYGDDRFGYTQNLSEHYPFLQQLSLELVNILKSELIHLGPAHHILTQLAQKPVSLRRIEGKSWKEIESDLYNPITKTKNSMLENELQEIIDLTKLVDCETTAEWETEVSVLLGQELSEIKELISSLQERREIRWSAPIGAFIAA